METEIERRVPRERLDRLAGLVTTSRSADDHGSDGIESPFTGRVFGRALVETPTSMPASERGEASDGGASRSLQ